MNLKVKKFFALAGSALALSGAGLMSVGCNSTGSAPTSHDTSAMSAADKIKAIQASNMPDQQKQNAINLVNSHPNGSSVPAP